MQDLDKVRAKIAMQEGLLAYLLYSLKVTESDRVASACTNGTEILVNPKFWDQLSLGKKVGLIMHELLHIVFEHSWALQQVKEQDHQLFNLVGDVVVNKTLNRHGYVIPDGGIMNFHQLGFSELDSEDVTEHTTIWFYEQIIKKCPKVKVQINADGSVDMEINGRKVKMQSRCVEKGNGGSQNKDMIKGLLETAAMMCKSFDIGSMSASLITYIDRFVKTRTDWRTILKQYFNIVNEEELTYTKPKQRGRIIRPTLKPLYPNGVNIILIVDSSGSIDDDTLRMFASEIYKILQEVESEIYLIVNDADIQLQKLITDVNEIPKKFPGRGGTVFKKAFERLNKEVPIEDPVVVVLTDGEIADLDKLSAPQYEIIWMIVNNERFKAPFGRVINVHYN